MLGTFLRDVMRRNSSTFRVFSPDENNSNRLGAVLEVTERAWSADRLPGDDHLAPDGRVMEILSEHTCQGWLEGYLLTGRHGFFSCYEAFIHIVDSMVNQHAKWLKTTNGIPWRRPIASLNYLLTSHVWRQDHNGFSHQDPGFIDHVVNKRAEVVRVYLPPDANTLLSVADHCLRSRQYVNVIVAGKQPALQYLDIDTAVEHCTKGLGIWEWASTDAGVEPDVVMACAGDVPTMETLAAVEILRGFFPDLRIRVVNVVDLMRLQDDREHPHGLSDAEFDSYFTTDRPVIFAYHGYPWLIHRLTYRRANHENMHVRGYVEEGTTTTPFDMCVMNRLDRFDLAIDVIDRVPRLRDIGAHARDRLRDQLIEHRRYIRTHGEDLPEVRDWAWSGKAGPVTGGSDPEAGARAVRLLVVNAGSSSLKLSLLDDDGAVATATTVENWQGPGDLEPLRDFLATCGRIDAVGHRVVHGGPRHTGPEPIDELLISSLYSISHLAPLHNPRALAGIRATDELLPGRPGGGLLRHDLPRHAAGCRGHLRPAAGVERAVGVCAGTASTGCPTPTPCDGAPSSSAARSTSCGSCRRTSAPVPPWPPFGAGCRWTRRWASRRWTGLVMNTRPGSLDPGLLLWLLEHGGEPRAEVADVLEHHAGLKGLSGTSGDLREVLAGADGGDPACVLARDVYLHRLARETAAMTAATGGLDLLVLTGGVGEHSWQVREALTDALAHLGLAVDPGRNRATATDGDVSADGAAARTVVVTAREDLEIRRQVLSALSPR